MFHVCHYVPTTTTTTTTCHRPFILTLSATISLSLRAICVFCHLLLTAPFSGNLDTPSRLPQWERSLPPLLSCLVSSIFKPSKLIPTFLIPSSRFPSQATWVCHLVALVGVLVASLSPGGTYDSSDPCCRLSLSQACLTLFSVTVLCISF